MWSSAASEGAARISRLAKECERLLDVLRGLHFVVFAILVMPKAVLLLMATSTDPDPI